MKNFKTALTITALLVGTSSAYAASHAGAPMAMGDSKKATARATPADMTDGEVRKVDIDSKKITLKHGDIKNIDMPGMTMVFQVKDPAMLSKIKAGDKIRFRAEKINGAIVVTDIQPAK